MTRKNTTRPKSRTLSRALAALAVVIGAGLIGAAPARADGPHFNFSFGIPFPPFPVPVPVYEPPRYYEPAPEVYYEPAPRVYYEPPVVYAPAPVYVERPVYYGRPYYGRPCRHHDDWDRPAAWGGGYRGHYRDWDDEDDD